MTTKFLIYGLFDPRDGQLRYVGKSCKGLYRPREHAMPSVLSRDKTYKGNWIRGLIVEGMKPEIGVLEEHDDPASLLDSEIWHIAYWRSLGCRLTNLTAGGEGTLGRKKSESEIHRLKISNMEARRKISVEQETQLCEMYRQGSDSYRLAEMFGIERHTVIRWLRKNGVPIRGKRQVCRALPIALIPEVAAAYRSGLSTPELARRYDTYPSTIYNALKRYGAPLRTRAEAQLVRR